MILLMPALSPTMTEGVLAKWNVKVGDKITPGDVIAEIETDKAVMEFEAVDEGVIGKILCEASSNPVKVNAPIAVLLEDGEEMPADIDALLSQASGQTANNAENAEAKENNDANEPKKEEEVEKTSSPAPAPAVSNSTTSVTKDSHATNISANGRIFASPLAKKLAKMNNIDLSLVKGTGPHGRIVKRDIENFKAAPKTDITKAAPTKEAGISAASFGQIDNSINNDEFDTRLYDNQYEIVPNSSMRKIIAQRLSKSFNQDVPHFPLLVDVNLDSLLSIRQRLNDRLKDKNIKVSVNDFVIKACAHALIEVPEANASFTKDAIIKHKHADIGVAVALEDGLITPIIRRAETLSLSQISIMMKDMAKRARERKLLPHEFQGGSFSVSNLGMFGIKQFASIVNQPHGAIMSVGAGEKKPVVINDEIKIATIMSVTLTCDHRVVDGAVGARFLQIFKSFIEEPALMIA